MRDEDGRCFECDAKYTHGSQCSQFTEASALSVEQRVAIYAMVAAS